MQSRPSFPDWVRGQQSRKDSVGEFARTILSDPDFGTGEIDLDALVNSIEYKGGNEEQLQNARNALAEYNGLSERKSTDRH